MAKTHEFHEINARTEMDIYENGQITVIQERRITNETMFVTMDLESAQIMFDKLKAAGIVK